MTTLEHVPVLVRETTAYLAPERGGWYVDCTLGLGGHAAAVLERGPAARLLGIDRDPQALALAAQRLAPFGARAVLARGRFSQLRELAAAHGIETAAGVLADLGVSSIQLDQGERGFAFSRPGPLDMRMGGDGPSAKDIIHDYPEDDLARLFHAYGEERQARRIARAIAEKRAETTIETTAELADLVERVKGPAPRPRKRKGARRPPKPRTHPATQVFQALRIEVNQELDELRTLLDQATGLLQEDGRLVVISYHSLEDREVKHRLRALDRGEVDPVTGQTRTDTQVMEILTKRPVRPSDDEVAENPRARSARLRAARRRARPAAGEE